MNLKIFTLLIIGIWLGIMIGISFVEAPLKFRGPGITMKLGVGIGRIVFNASHKIQLGLFLIVLSCYLWNGLSFQSPLLYTFLVITLLLGVQTFYLLPCLDDRAIRLLNDHPTQNSFHHIGFIVTEICKVIYLTILFQKTYHHA